jgi:hypothetical protein
MSEPLQIVPTLDVLVSDPNQVFQLSPHSARMLLGGLVGLLPALVAQAARDTGTPQTSPTTERWLTVKEASEMFHVKERWLKTHKDKLPHSKPSRKVLLFPELKLRSWLAAHKAN